MIKGYIVLENITTPKCMYLITKFQKYVKQKLIELQEKFSKSIIILPDFNIRPSVSDRKSRQKISKDINILNRTTY